MRACLDEDGAGRARIARRDRKERGYSIDCVWPNGEAWFRSLGKKGRNNFWRGERILADLGGEIAFHALDPTKQSISQELQQTLELKRSWVKETNRSSPLLGGDGKAFEAMIHAVSGRGLLRLFLLTCGDKIAAASVNFVHSEQVDEAYLTSYAPEFERAITRHDPHRPLHPVGVRQRPQEGGLSPRRRDVQATPGECRGRRPCELPRCTDADRKGCSMVHAWMSRSTRKAADAAVTTSIGRLATGS